jgi:hypothetical protein
MEKPNLKFALSLNALVCLMAILTIGLLEWRALCSGIDGVAMSLSVGTIGLIVGVKGKDIKDAITGVFKK